MMISNRKSISTKGRRLARTRLMGGAALLAIAAAPAGAAVIGADGGITLWISFDNLDALGASLSDTMTETDSLPGGYSCSATESGRSAVGASSSPPSCPGGASTCTAEEKITADLTKFADYIYQSTEGNHYLRRVYLSDQGRAWDSADIKWNIGVGGSSAPYGWNNADLSMNLNSGYRYCIHDVVHHEFGHYFYNLPDRYARADGYYKGTMPGSSTVFDVDITGRDINTVMSNNFPHLFVDTTNASITVDYDPPGPSNITGEVLTPSLLSDGDSTNDGPNRAHHSHTTPFAQDEWSLLPTRHADLTGVHTEGTFASVGATPALDIVIIGDDEPHPGTVLLLDRSGSMGVTTNGVTAAQYVQEAGMFLYHSAEDDDYVGTSLYNASVEELFAYDVYNPANDLPFASFRNASGLTDIAGALKSGIDALIAEHGEGGVNGAELYLMSDGKQTTGASLWDQVTRANERGIKIHTFSFGDADTSTMDAISSGTSGSSTPMSERDDAAELKMLMTRKFNTGRGMTPIAVHKGAMREKINLGSTQVWPGEFYVPPKTAALQFYTFFPVANASDLTIELRDPTGASFVSAPANNLTVKGRFNGVKLDGPKAGKWTFLIAGKPGSPIPSEPIELAAYADNRELKGNSWFDGAKGDALQLRARLNWRYPMTDMTVRSKLYARGAEVGAVTLYDDGASGGDTRARDGIYSGLITLSDEEWKKRLGSTQRLVPKIRVETEFQVTPKSVPAPYAHYETGFTPAMALANYKRGNVGTFRAFATNVFDLKDYKEAKPKLPRLRFFEQWKPQTIMPGRGGQIGFYIEGARPLPSQLRISLGEGVATQLSEVRDNAGPKTPEQVIRKIDPKARVKQAPVIKTEEVERMVKAAPSIRLPGASEPEPTLTYYVVNFRTTKKTAPGPRTLRVQFGQTMLELDNAIVIGK